MLSRSLRNSISLLFVLAAAVAFGQKIESYTLPEELNEISGLEQLNDSTLIAINDSGNDAILYLLGVDGTLKNSVKVDNVRNNDWEDLAIDDKHLYIADIGNNLNNRRNLAILKVSLKDLEKKSTVQAEKIQISYSEQMVFPPEKDSLYFDAESIAVQGDSIVLIGKNKVVPWDGKAMVYMIPKKPGNYSLEVRKKLDLGNGGWRTASATAMDIYKGTWYILTYGKLALYREEKSDFVWDHTYKFRNFTQKESVVVTEDSIFVADEKQKLLGGGKLYRIYP